MSRGCGAGWGFFYTEGPKALAGRRRGRRSNPPKNSEKVVSPRARLSTEPKYNPGWHLFSRVECHLTEPIPRDAKYVPKSGSPQIQHYFSPVSVQMAKTMPKPIIFQGAYPLKTV
jgi:hypothetical protein